jgi:colicin import membrane protein
VPRPLKVFKTHIGFYDMIVAAPSMKAAAAAWGSTPAIFTHGLAAVTQEADAVQAGLARPGTVLKRPYGQGGAYKAEPDAVAMPKLSIRQKQVAKKNQAERKRAEAAAERARQTLERKTQKDAEEQLAEIEREEAELRYRRKSLQKKFHLRSSR